MLSFAVCLLFDLPRRLSDQLTHVAGDREQAATQVAFLQAIASLAVHPLAVPLVQRALQPLAATGQHWVSGPEFLLPCCRTHTEVCPASQSVERPCDPTCLQVPLSFCKRWR